MENSGDKKRKSNFSKQGIKLYQIYMQNSKACELTSTRKLRQ